MTVRGKGLTLAGVLIFFLAAVAAQPPQPGFDEIYSEGFYDTKDISSAPDAADSQRARGDAVDRKYKCLKIGVSSSPVGASTYVFSTSNYNAWKAGNFSYTSIPALKPSCNVQTACNLTINLSDDVNHYIVRLPPQDDPTTITTGLTVIGKTSACTDGINATPNTPTPSLGLPTAAPALPVVTVPAPQTAAYTSADVLTALQQVKQTLSALEQSYAGVLATCQ